MNTRPPGGRCCGSGYPDSLGSSVCPEDPREAHDAGKGHADREQNQAVGQAIDRDAIGNSHVPRAWLYQRFAP